MNKFTNAEKAAEAQREVAMRWRIYGRTRPAMNDPEKKRRIEMMQEIANDYLRLAQIDDQEGRLAQIDDEQERLL